ncbi:hypothetical protein SAMN02745130_01246 [Thiothrix eikelboomii]|uniref:Uncharacterized protein n=1 Tax=Thiothrix eikelboomii TaxID=92487 RepID=A0A1T4W9A0_9GAMM|nr:hypothetical protein [Thiothrix eikelboomii]SKA73565.1 hypothetical protein SAMN02745130_01246 [Thiothrix eikelboomii]
MLELTPNNIYPLTLISSASLALVLTLVIAFKWKIPNPSFALVRSLSSFAMVWLLWGRISGSVNFNQGTGETKIGLFDYLIVQHTRHAEQTWLAQAALDTNSLLLTLLTTGLIIFSINWILSRLAAISDRRL